jgi:tetratricopeptide (TPR) repeat protein
MYSRARPTENDPCPTNGSRRRPSTVPRGALPGTILVLAVSSFVVLSSCAVKPTEDRPAMGFETLSGPYFGQDSPGDEPQLFMPGQITTHWSEAYIAFLDDARMCVYSMITDKGLETLYTYEKDGYWTSPQRAPFEELQGHPNYTTGPEGRKVYFHSGRPTHPGDTRPDDNIWAIEWTGTGWAEPYPLPAPANSDYGEAYPSVTIDGTAYFCSWRRPGIRANDIYRSRCIDGDYQEPERLEWPINTDYIEYDPYVAPDESYLIFGSTRPGGFGGADNYISFRRNDGSWTAPVNLGPGLNSRSGDLCANGTPDGKYFFFSSGRSTDVPKGEKVESAIPDQGHDYDLYWVETSFIEKLRESLLTRESVAEVIRDEYQSAGLESAIKMLTALYAEKRGSYYFEPYELLSLCEQMIAMERIGDAEAFSRALADALPRELQIKEGFAQICMMNGRIARGMAILKELDAEDPSFDLSDSLSSLGYLLTLYPEKADDALELLHFTVKEFPDSPFAYYSLARLYRDRGETEQAIRYCRKCLELKPNFGDAAGLLDALEGR